MPEMIRLSNGNDVSQETVDAAMEEYTLRHPEEYIFQAGDVVENKYNAKRVIVKVKIDDNCGETITRSVGLDGEQEHHCQSGFEEQGYRKIGVLSDYIK
ncbi:hypothetical protein LCGC14_1594430 [marine sediment metagenome]|uniref:Uncharacterized protein n=1 Tax=marine sediment metagenome TaxID=412755 RepID=A0A0F9IDI8_9ZZZZ